MGLVSAVLGVGGGVGMVLSGLIADNLSWRLLFVVGAGVVAWRSGWCGASCPESPARSPSRPDLGAPRCSPPASWPCWWA